MKVAIDVESKQEASAITAAMKDPVTRAFVTVTGTLVQLGSEQARERVMELVRNHFAAMNDEEGRS